MRDRLEPGARVGKYVVIRELGRGGMGVVYEAREPDLERHVALKLLRGEQPTHAMRLLREAQVLAQLQHPNIVTVHALDLHEDRVVVVMELVDGETLEAYIARTKPDWRATVALFVQAGQGLAAAHAKGIVHRDVKPANILVDRAGRVRVGDFGIARQWSADEPTAGSAVESDISHADTVDDANTTQDTVDPAPRVPPGSALTAAGTVLGTPRYMSPEQLDGMRVSPASDQFSFCVALWLALYGAHPFVDETKRVQRAPHPKRAVPRWLERAIDRGLAIDPRARFPSMSALLAALDRRPVRWLAATAGVLALAGGATAFVLSTRSSGPACPVPETPAWAAARREQLHRHVLAIDPKDGEATFTQVAPAIDALVKDWRETYVGACEATRVRGEQSDSMYDARMRCLRQAMRSIETSIALLDTAKTPEALAEAAVGIGSSTGASTCTAAALEAAAAVPLPPAKRERGEALVRRLAELDAFSRGGWKPDLPAQIGAVVVDARSLGHDPTLLQALWTQMVIEMRASHQDVVEAVLREVAQLAARLHDFSTEAQAWMHLLGVVGFERNRPDEALALVPAAKAAVARAGDPIGLRARLVFSEAQLLGSAGQLPTALARLEEARKMIAVLGAEADTPYFRALVIEIAQEQGTTYALSRKFAESEVAFREAIDTTRKAYGPDTVDEASILTNLAEMFKDSDQLDRARETANAAIRIHEMRGGEFGSLANSLDVLATIEGTAGHWDKALPLYDRAIEIRRRSVGPGDPEMIPALTGRGWVLDNMGRTAEALAVYDEIIAIGDSKKLTSQNVSAALNNRAELRAKAGKHVESSADYARCIAMLEALLGKTAEQLRWPLAMYAQELLALGQFSDAVSPLERSLAIADDGSLDALEVRGMLARALVTSKHDVARGRTLAAEIDKKLAAHKEPEAAKLRAKIRGWVR